MNAYGCVRHTLAWGEGVPGSPGPLAGLPCLNAMNRFDLHVATSADDGGGGVLVCCLGGATRLSDFASVKKMSLMVDLMYACQAAMWIG